MKTTGAAPSRPINSIELWEPDDSDLKHYPHFDAPLRLSEIRSLVNDPSKVAKNPFFPLIQYEKKWQPFRGKSTQASANKPKPKSRKIRFAARRDAYIYARYRRILSPLYEKALSERKINDIPIAYRKIKNESGRGKCNIDFAKDVFDFIISCGDCFVITLDISKFFESLDHKAIETAWKGLLSVNELPEDHAAVFRSLTDYRWVDRTEAYERLGYFGKKAAKNGTQRKGYLRPYNQMPKQLCPPRKFRELIAGKGNLASIIRKNPNNFGIPQGTPISDLIANFYLMDFDKYIKKISSKYNGKSFRYSDDILIVIQSSDLKDAMKVEEDIRKSISSFGKELFIKEEKSSIHQFIKRPSKLSNFLHIKGAGKNGLEYLGFRFDGTRVFLRDSTLSNLKRKITFSGRIRAQKHASRFPDRNANKLIETFNFDDFFQNFMRVEEFDTARSVKSWTFWTYARRASEAFGALGRPIVTQLKWLKPDGKRKIIKILNSSR